MSDKETFAPVAVQGKQEDSLTHISEDCCLLDVDEGAYGRLVSERGGCSCYLSAPCSACTEPFTEDELNSVGYTMAPANAVVAPQVSAMATPQAMAVITQAMRNDPEYAWSWHCNIAMSVLDEGLDHYRANKAAARFMSLLAGIDTAKHPGFPQKSGSSSEFGSLVSSDIGLLERAKSSMEDYLNSTEWGKYDKEVLEELARRIEQLRKASTLSASELVDEREAFDIDAARQFLASFANWRPDPLNDDRHYRALAIALDYLGDLIGPQALALPTAEQVDDINVAESFTSVTKTAPPVGEREEFEQFAQNCPMGKYNVTRRGEGYDSSHTQIMWDAWQSGRAALRAGDAVDAQRLDFIEESARCDPKMDGQHVWWPTSLNKALKGSTLRDAIDAAIRARGEAV